MPEDKEWSAVTALLNEINKLRERVEALEIYTWAYMTRWINRTDIWYRWSWGNLWPRPSIDWTPEWIGTDVPVDESPISLRNAAMYRDDTIYATTDDNITIPLTWIGWHYATYCASSHS